MPSSSSVRPTDSSTAHSTPAQVFLTFLKLGFTSFGGPVAHLAFFRKEFVDRRRWLDDARFASLVTLCQSLPGPSSSQVGLLIGHSRGGLLHALSAWLGFTLPGALAMACAAALLGAVGMDSGWIGGLEAFSVAVVAQAVWTMSRSLTPDATRLALALAATLVCRLVPGGFGQIAAIALGAGWGHFLSLVPAGPAVPHGIEPVSSSRRHGVVLLGILFGLAAALPLIGGLTQSRLWTLLDGTFRSGAMVFGGGHVVLPLLQAEVAARLGIPADTFLAGYGIVQGLPGPLFNVASFLGYAAEGIPGALLAVVAIFLPGALLALGVMPFWTRLQGNTAFRRILPGINAAVVGVLFAAFLDPVCTRGLGGWPEATLAVIALGLLLRSRIPAWVLALGSAAGGLLIHGL